MAISLFINTFDRTIFIMAKTIYMGHGILHSDKTDGGLVEYFQPIQFKFYF